tara:strand:+ start:327 stop:875 length:549 start_codon:yes stop_codon:yes gene_type:complete
MNRDIGVVFLATFFLSATMLSTLFAYQINGETMELPYLFGDKKVSLLDIWSLQHFLTGICLGAFAAAAVPDSRTWTFVLGFICLSYFWERQEVWGELTGNLFDTISIPAVREWLGGVEHWSNRLIADPLLVTAGALLGRNLMNNTKMRTLKSIAVATGLFFVIHVVSPDSMALQNWIIGTEH